jgi:hypothetical protein
MRKIFKNLVGAFRTHAGPPICHIMRKKHDVAEARIFHYNELYAFP